VALRKDTSDRRQKRFLPEHNVDSVWLDILDRSKGTPEDEESTVREGVWGQKFGRQSPPEWKPRLLRWEEERQLENPRRDSVSE